jgi:hypothetical protein
LVGTNAVTPLVIGTVYARFNEANVTNVATTVKLNIKK